MIGDEPIGVMDAVRGWVKSGGYAHGSRKTIAMGYVPKGIADEARRFETELPGARRAAMQQAPLFNANLKRLRG